MATIEPFQFYGQTPYELHFDYAIDADHTGSFTIVISEPVASDTVALEALIAAIDADPAWTFTSGSIARSGAQMITP